MKNEIQKLLDSRKGEPLPTTLRKQESEGGCGVIGVACAEKIAGRHLLPPLLQMKNRGNGKGGGIAAAGLSPQTFGISQEILDHDYLLAIAYLDNTLQQEVEKRYIYPLFEVDHLYSLKSLPNVPATLLYFVRVKKEKIQDFREKHQLTHLSDEQISDELLYQNSYQLNRSFYAAEGEKKAFVLSHGKNLLVLKCVGFADETIRGYHLEDVEAHIWIGHHRYPTKGRVWHPGGAHPFVGLHEALVHNGDFANYSAICEYLAQRNIYPLFLTDTEISVLLFDLLSRTYRYPLEYVMEAMAPTTERDLINLPEEKQKIYDCIQKTHLHASPDGPWFFLIAQSHYRRFRLIGLTDTSMLRPQVFAIQKGVAPIGMIASEKQAIDALFLSLAEEDSRFWPRADIYWNCRGGSYTDGGAFTFTVEQQDDGTATLHCRDKFEKPFASALSNPPPAWNHIPPTSTEVKFPDLPGEELFTWVKERAHHWKEGEAQSFFDALQKSALSEQGEERAFLLLANMLDFVYPLNNMRRSFFLALVEQCIAQVVGRSAQKKSGGDLCILDARHFPSEGEKSLAREIVRRYKEGCKRFIVGNCRGQRFIANGLGPSSDGVELDIFGSAGDYLASGIDGASIRLHGSAQDQIAQIMRDGKLVIFGDVGQTFLYGAKGGRIFVRGSTAGRPLINAVGSVKLVINGTSLDYFAESFMAGDPLRGGGFAIVNGITFNAEGEIVELDSPFPGNNLFSLASGGAIYIRDPEHQLDEGQLNGGEFAEITPADQELILPYLEENAQLFAIPLSRLLEKEGKQLTLSQAYRKIVPSSIHFIDPEKAWVTAPVNFRRFSH
jgi:glutamate synthase domain-containing protein 1/glutamate synthase domain-containing protein 3